MMMKVDLESGFLLIKQYKGSIERLYRIRIRSILNSYIEGPFGGYDEANEPQECWRVVITAMRCSSCRPTEKDVVLYVPTKELAENALNLLTDRLDF